MGNEQVQSYYSSQPDPADAATRFLDSDRGWSRCPRTADVVSGALMRPADEFGNLAGRKILRREKPWGRFEQYTHNLPSTVKIITVAPGGTLSSQYHHRRDELWVVLDPGARVEIGGEVVDPEAGEKLFIPRGMVHRLSAGGAEYVRILEISFGEFDEGDIVRLEDVYGRGRTDADSQYRRVAET